MELVGLSGNLAQYNRNELNTLKNELQNRFPYKLITDAFAISVRDLQKYHSTNCSENGELSLSEAIRIHQSNGYIRQLPDRQFPTD